MSVNEPSSPVCYAGSDDEHTPLTQPLRLLVLGTGAIGGYIGGRLLETGANLTFLVRDERLPALSETTLQVFSPLGDMQFQPQLITRNDLVADYDVILLTCKAYDLDSAVETIAPAVADNTSVLPLLNGLAHLTVLDQRFGRDRIMGGLAHLAVERRDHNSIHHLNSFHRLVFGERHPAQKDHAARLQVLFDHSALESERSDNIEQAQWEKFIFLTTLAGATCLFRGSIGEILQTISGEAFILGLLDECIAVAAAAGFPPQEETLADYRNLLTDRTAAYTASMLRDIQAGQRTEADHILGDMLGRAQDRGLAHDHLALAYSHLQVYENRF